MRELSLENWIKEGHGYTADSYRNKDDENLLLKLFFTGDGKELAEREYIRAVNVAALGVPTPSVYELVSVDGMIGILFERIEHKRSFGKLCTEDPEGLPKYAAAFARGSKKLHSTKCNTEKFPNQKEVLRKLVCRGYVRKEVQDYLNRLLDKTPDGDTCLHGDLQTGNMVMGWCQSYEGRKRQEGEDERTYFIDLGHFAYGNPLFDIASLYLSAKVYQNEESNQNMLHFTAEQFEEFWKYYAISYIDSDDPVELQKFEDRVAPYAMFFMVLIISVSDGYEPAIQMALSHIEELYEKYH